MSKKLNRYPEQLIKIAEDYALEHNTDTIDLDKVSEWAIANNRFYRPPKSQKQILKEELGKALRAERHVDPQGRTVRSKVPYVVGEQLRLWVDTRAATTRQMEVATQQRRQMVFRDVMRLKTDVDSFNDNNIYNGQVPMPSFNFEPDIEEAAQSTTYDDYMDEDELFEEVPVKTHN